MTSCIGAAALLLGIGILIGTLYERRRKEELKFLPISSVASLLTIHSNVVGQLGTAMLYERCKVSGIIDTDRSTGDPVEQGPPVLYKSRTQYKDPTGEIVRTQHREEQHARFWVRDDTGSVLVDPLGATIELARPETHETDTEILRMEALREGQHVFILGWLTDFHGQPMIANKGTGTNVDYIITWRPEQAMIVDAKETVAVLRWSGIILTVVGVVMVGLGLL